MRMVALLRGINVGGHKKVPMTDLQKVSAALGLKNVATYIQSGNLVFDSDFPPESARAKLESAIQKRFGFKVDLMIRSDKQWKKLIATNPFPEAAKADPKFLHAGLCAESCSSSIAARIESHATLGEQVKVIGGTLWIHFVGGAGPSKLTPALLDRYAGSPVTMRNWNTVLKLGEML